MTTEHTPEPDVPRQNRNGHPCPPWCRTDHEKDQGAGLRLTHHADTPAFILTSEGAYAAAGRVQTALSDGPKVTVTSSSEVPGALWLEPGDALKLAGAVEALAAATPDQHREFAAAIRGAAALIMAEDEGGEEVPGG